MRDVKESLEMFWYGLSNRGRVVVIAVLLVILGLFAFSISGCTVLKPWQELAAESTTEANKTLLDKAKKEKKKALEKLND